MRAAVEALENPLADAAERPRCRGCGRHVALIRGYACPACGSTLGAVADATEDPRAAWAAWAAKTYGAPESVPIVEREPEARRVATVSPLRAWRAPARNRRARILRRK